MRCSLAALVALAFATTLLAPALAMPPVHVLPRFVDVNKSASTFLVFVGDANATSRSNASDWNRDEVYDEVSETANASAHLTVVPTVALAWANASAFDSHRMSRLDHATADAHVYLATSALPPLDLGLSLACVEPRNGTPSCVLVP
ncbi:MAG: hypothetical protein ACYDCK_13380 [Thermoplasmatota archaeon]